MTLEQEAKKDYKKLEQITKCAKNREEILGLANAWMEEAIMRNDITNWFEEAVQKIVPGKAEEVQRYVLAKIRAYGMEYIRQHRDAKIVQATEE